MGFLVVLTTSRSLARALLGRAQIAIQVHYAGSDESAHATLIITINAARENRRIAQR